MSTATRINVALAGLLVLIVAAHWALPSAPTQRNFHFFPNMVNSLAHEAQAPAPLLAGGVVADLRPPEGSVARGYLRFSYEATPEDAARAGGELRNPHSDDTAAVDDTAAATDTGSAVERGGFVYVTFCATCHGAGGEGDGPVTPRGVPPPPSLLLPHALELADGQMYHIITLGQGNMAGYAAQVERADRWNVISYVRTLQASAPAPEAPPDETTSVEEEATP